MKRVSSLVMLVAGVILVGAEGVNGGIVADFGADMQPDTPKAGWSYLWNPSGVQIGDVAGYHVLLAAPQPANDGAYYDPTGSSSIPAADPAAYLFFGGTGTTGFGHPGRGSSQASDGLEHYAIAAYTVAESGDVSIINSMLTTTNNSTFGIHARVFVNNTDTGLNAMTGAGDSSTSFNADLGLLHAGDTIYVAIGGGAYDFADSFNLGYQISVSAVVPEPASIALLGSGTVILLGCGYIRRRKATEGGKGVGSR